MRIIEIGSFALLAYTGGCVVRNDYKQTQATKDEASRKKGEEQEHGYILQGICKGSGQAKGAERHEQGNTNHPGKQNAHALFESESLVPVVGKEDAPP